MRGVTDDIHADQLTLSFLLTRLMRGVTAIGQLDREAYVFLLTRLMRGVTVRLYYRRQENHISTHTPHARRDTKAFGAIGVHVNFYSHASCEA